MTGEWVSRDELEEMAHAHGLLIEVDGDRRRYVTRWGNREINAHMEES